MCTISILMPVFNGEKYLEEAISSVLKQTFDDFELICVDDGSTDNSRKIIESLNDSRIKYIFQKNSGSPAKGRNTGLALSKGEFITFIDQDDIYHPNSLQERLDCFRSEKDLVFLYSDCNVIDENGKIISNSIIGYTKKVPQTGNCFRELFLGIFIPIQGVMVKKKIITELGGFNEELKGTDDYQMWLRVAYYYSIKYLDKRLAYWRKHNDSLSHKQKTMDEAFVKGLESVTKLFPDYKAKIGKKEFKQRMQNLSFDVAYRYYKSKEWPDAKRWLYRCLRYRFSVINVIRLMIVYFNLHIVRV